MSDQPDRSDEALWRRLVDSHLAFARATQEFSAAGVDRVGLLRRAFGNADRHTAMYMVSRLSTSELKELFDILLTFATSDHGFVQTARDLILSLPRAWVVERIGELAEQRLEAGPDSGTDADYRRLLEVYVQLDRDINLGLACRAAAHADPEIREVGEEFLERLGAR